MCPFSSLVFLQPTTVDKEPVFLQPTTVDKEPYFFGINLEKLSQKNSIIFILVFTITNIIELITDVDFKYSYFI